jgi:hypothetical protein
MYFNFSDDVAPLCDTLWICYAAFIDIGWKTDGGFFGQFSINYFDFWNLDARVFYDYSYIFITLILIPHILSAIIIDTFS